MTENTRTLEERIAELVEADTGILRTRLNRVPLDEPQVGEELILELETKPAVEVMDIVAFDTVRLRTVEPEELLDALTDLIKTRELTGAPR